MKKPKHKERHGGAALAAVPQATVNLKLQYVIPENLIAAYADQFFVSHTEEGFVLTFYQNQHPADMREASLGKARTMKSMCVARIIVPPKQMDKIIDALITNWNRFMDKEDEQESTDGQESTEAEPESE
jgi:hypothetical protein